MRTHRLAAFAAIALFVSACGGGTATTAPTQSTTQPPATLPPASVAPTQKPITPPTSLVTAGTLTDCVDIEYPPMEYFASKDITDPNQATGFDVDAAKRVGAVLGLKVEIRNTGFDALIPDLAVKRCDIVWSALYVSDERLKQADAVPYMATGHAIMVPVGNPKGIKAVADLCGKTISIQNAGVVEINSKKASDDCVAAGKAAITIQGYKTVAEEFQQIVVGRVDAVWETDTAVLNYMYTNPNKYEMAFAFPRDRNYGIYYGKGLTDLGTALTAAVAALNADGTLAALATKNHIDPAVLQTVK